MRNKQIKNTRFGTEFDGDSAPFAVHARGSMSYNYVIDVFGGLDNLSDIQDAIYALSIAEEDDTVQINLNSPGGSIHIADTLIMAMKKCLAPVHIIASGQICSAATFIILSADSFEISPFTTIMCHSASYGFGGSMEDVRNYTEFQFNQCMKTLRYYYFGFLSGEEIHDLVYNKRELWMDSKEFVQRFKNRMEAIEKLNLEDTDAEVLQEVIDKTYQ